MSLLLHFGHATGGFHSGITLLLFLLPPEIQRSNEGEADKIRSKRIFNKIRIRHQGDPDNHGPKGLIILAADKHPKPYRTEDSAREEFCGVKILYLRQSDAKQILPPLKGVYGIWDSSNLT